MFVFVPDLFKNLPAGYYRDLQTSGQSMCSNGSFAIETFIKIYFLVKTVAHRSTGVYSHKLMQLQTGPGFYRSVPHHHEVSGGRGTGDDVFLGRAQESRCTLLSMHTYFSTKNSAGSGPHLCMSLQHFSFSLLLQ